MGEFGPGINGRWSQFFESVANQFGPSFIKNGFSCLNIPFPGADARTFNNRFKPLFLDLYSRFSLLSFGDILKCSVSANNLIVFIESEFGKYFDPTESSIFGEVPYFVTAILFFALDEGLK